jgi:hypothetical protein
METNRYLNHDNEILIKRYEELRSQVLNNGILHYDKEVKAKGYVLFLRHGMAGWLKAWSLCKEFEPASPEEKVRPENNPITDDMKYQAIIILANMALYSRKEVATLC